MPPTGTGKAFDTPVSRPSSTSQDHPRQEAIRNVLRRHHSANRCGARKSRGQGRVRSGMTKLRPLPARVQGLDQALDDVVINGVRLPAHLWPRAALASRGCLCLDCARA